MVDGKFWDLFPAWDVKDMPELSGKVAIVTGPTATRLNCLDALKLNRAGLES